MLLAENISCSAGAKQLVNNCTLSVKPGIFTAIVGPNGAGKTSLLKVLSHERTRYDGFVKMNGIAVSGMNHRVLSQTRAVLPQHSTVNFPFTVEQVIAIGRYAHRSTKEENENVINEIIMRTNLVALKDRTYYTLSGGEQQRVQMARVMAQIWDKSESPKYLLLDEPTSSLDLAQQHSLLTLAKALCERNVGVAAILHDLNLAAQYADEIVFMKQGSIVAQGETLKVMTASVIEKTFDHPVKVLRDASDGYPIVYPLSNIHKRKLIDKVINNYAYEQHSY